MTDKEKRIRSLIAKRSVVAAEDIDGAFHQLQQRDFRSKMIKSRN